MISDVLLLLDANNVTLALRCALKRVVARCLRWARTASDTHAYCGSRTDAYAGSDTRGHCDAGIEELRSRISTIENVLASLADWEKVIDNLSDLRGLVLSTQESFESQKEKQGLRHQALEAQLAEAAEVGRKGMKPRA